MSPIPSSSKPQNSFLDHSFFGSATHKQVYTYLTLFFLVLLLLITFKLLNECRHTYDPIPSPSSLAQESRFTERTALLLESKRLKIVQVESALQVAKLAEQQQQSSALADEGEEGGEVMGGMQIIGVHDRSESWRSGDTLVDDAESKIAELNGNGKGIKQVNGKGKGKAGVVRKVESVVKVNAKGERVNRIKNPIGKMLEFVGVEDGDVEGLVNNGFDEVRAE